jgi:hypothetical protein
METDYFVGLYDSKIGPMFSSVFLHHFSLQTSFCADEHAPTMSTYKAKFSSFWRCFLLRPGHCKSNPLIRSVASTLPIRYLISILIPRIEFL